VTAQPAEEDILKNEYEQWARERLTPLLGTLRVIDGPGAPPGSHDFEADLPDGSIAALEVTGEVDEVRRKLASAADRRLASIHLPDSTSAWWVGLAAGAAVSAIREADLLSLLGDLQSAGRRRVLDIGDYRDPFVKRLRSLRIESIYAWKAKVGREGTVTVRPGVYGGWGWDGPTIDAWLQDLLLEPRLTKKVRKLQRAAAAERHLVIVLDSFSQAGMGIPLGLTARRDRGAADYALPSLVPMQPLTHLWLLPPPVVPPWQGLRWSRRDGWSVLEAWSPPAPENPM
jgi:hypothetical protein